VLASPVVCSAGQIHLWTFADKTYLPLLETRASPTHTLTRIADTEIRFGLHPES